MSAFLKVTLINIGFFTMLTSFTSTQMIFSEMLVSHGYSFLGFHSFALLYLSWGIGCIFSSKWVKAWGFRKCMVVGCFF